MLRTLLTCCLIATAAAPSVQRREARPASVHNFGRVSQGATVTHEFRIPNPSASDPMRVVRVDLTGPGMTARFKPVTPAGQPVVIQVTWNTSRVEGEVEAQGIVRWADAARPPATFTIAGVVVPAIELRPMGAVFFSVFTDESAEQAIHIVNHDARPLAMRGIDPAGSHFTAAVRTIEPGRQHELRIHVPAGLAPGRFQEHVAVRTDSPARPVIRVPVNVLVKADVYANPEAVEFGTIPGATVRRTPSLVKLLTQTILVKRRQGAFEIRQATTDVPGLSLRLSPGGAQATHQIDVSLAVESLTPRSLHGIVRLVTSDPRFPRIDIPVRGRVQ
jgi:hypothetical protein